MVRDTSTGSVRFTCTVCGAVAPGGPYDARVAGAVLGAGETTEMYARLIQKASADRCNQLVAKVCSKCGLDYMTQIRVGESEAIVYTCSCGAIIAGEAAFQLMNAPPGAAPSGSAPPGAAPSAAPRQAPSAPG